MVAKIRDDIDLEMFPIGSPERKKEIFRLWYARNQEAYLSKKRAERAIDPIPNREAVKRHIKTFKGRAWKTAYKRELYRKNKALGKLKRKVPTDESRRLARERQNNPIYQWKQTAHRAVSAAIKNQTLNPIPCRFCKNKESVAHHDSYRREDFLKVKWLCETHHKAWHKVFIAELPEHLEATRKVENFNIG